jgi:hypothetical protein
MPLPALILSFLMAAGGDPVVVTGHFWAPFISPMGEPFRARFAEDDTLARWFYQADGNRDGSLTAEEMEADAERFFATLDTDHDGEIGPDELVHYEWEVAPDVQVMSKTRPAPGDTSSVPANGEQARDSGLRGHSRFRSGNAYGFEGAARYSLLNMPEPVAAADANFDRGITLAEFRQAAVVRFGLLDTGHLGRLTLVQLEALLPRERAEGRSKRRDDSPDTRVATPVPPGP